MDAGLSIWIDTDEPGVSDPLKEFAEGDWSGDQCLVCV